jgi:hypothetical protein
MEQILAKDSGFIHRADVRSNALAGEAEDGGAEGTVVFGESGSHDLLYTPEYIGRIPEDRFVFGEADGEHCYTRIANRRDKQKAQPFLAGLFR